MSGTQFQYTVLGEGKVRAKGELAFVLPQVLDLVSKSSYTASITEVRPSARGALRLKRTGNGDIQAHYTPNAHVLNGDPSPSWLGAISNLSAQLGRTITWQPLT